MPGACPISTFTWPVSGPREDAIAAATLGSVIAQQIPSLANYSLSARRDAALAEVMVSFAEQIAETGVFTGVGSPDPLTLYSLTSTNLNIDGTVVATATVAGGLTINPTVSLAGTAAAGNAVTAIYKSADTSTFHYSLVGYGELTAATTASVTGVVGHGRASHASGVTAIVTGLLGFGELTGAGTVTLLRGLAVSTLNSGAGTVTAGVLADLTAPTGTYGTLYGLRIANLTQGSTNYAIYTGSGRVRLGDVIETAASQESTGAGSANLSNNCPAVTPTAPYTWLKFRTSDGSTVYLPAWK